MILTGCNIITKTTVELWKSEEGTEIFINVQIAQFKAKDHFFANIITQKVPGNDVENLWKKMICRRTIWLGCLGNLSD